MKREHVIWFLLGVVGLLAAKYLVFGLDAWDAALHPGRVEPSSLDKYRKPFLLADGWSTT